MRDRIRVLVVDQGPGVPHAEQERIFLPFYRAPGAPIDTARRASPYQDDKSYLFLNECAALSVS